MYMRSKMLLLESFFVYFQRLVSRNLTQYVSSPFVHKECILCCGGSMDNSCVIGVGICFKLKIVVLQLVQHNMKVLG